MISWLKKHFMPHAGNGHRPHLLHGENARCLVLIAFMFEAIFLLGPVLNAMGGANLMAAVLPAVLSDLTNQQREDQNVPDLVVNPVLNEAATLKAEDMAAKGYFAHVSPDGTTPWHWFDAVGYDYQYAGENLAIDFVDSKDVTDAWMNSPTHRANIMKRAYTEVGTGVATGTYEGRTTVFVVQEYARPMALAAAKTVAPQMSAPSHVAATSSVAVAPTELATVEATTTAGPEVLGIATTAKTSAAAPSMFAKIESSPRHDVDVVLSVIGSLVLVALIFMLIRVNVRHPDLITNGLLVIAVLFGLYLANAYIGSRGSTTASSATASSFDAVSNLTQ